MKEVISKAIVKFNDEHTELYEMQKNIEIKHLSFIQQSKPKIRFEKSLFNENNEVLNEETEFNDDEFFECGPPSSI